MPGVKSRVIGTPCSDCGNPITPEVAVWRSNRHNGLMSYCRPCCNVRQRTTAKKNRHVGRLAQKRYYSRLRTMIVEGYGGACACCGERHPEFLALDHVNGGGNAHRATTKHSTIYADAVRRGFPPEYRLPPRPDDLDGWEQWEGAQPAVRRSVDGATEWLADALHLGGNGLVPQCAREAWGQLTERLRS
jgi:hypothetical protein